MSTISFGGYRKLYGQWGCLQQPSHFISPQKSQACDLLLLGSCFVLTVLLLYAHRLLYLGVSRPLGQKVYLATCIWFHVNRKVIN